MFSKKIKAGDYYICKKDFDYGKHENYNFITFEKGNIIQISHKRKSCNDWDIDRNKTHIYFSFITSFRYITDMKAEELVFDISKLYLFLYFRKLPDDEVKLHLL